MYKLLIENSKSAALSAIEIYNKPDFKYRNEIFTILMINAWELLLKAKLLSDNDNKIESLYIMGNSGNYKFNRNNNPLTIEIIGAINKLQLDEAIKENLFALIELRDTAIHFVNKEKNNYLIYTLGTACLKNYFKIIKKWFNVNLSEYNFYILPLAFAYNFKTFTIVDIEKEPKIIQSLLANISEKQNIKSEQGYEFTCEIEINLKSAKKITENTDLTASIGPNATNTITVIKTQKLYDQYPYSYNTLFHKLQQNISTLKQNHFNKFIRTNNVKDNEKYSAYNFRSPKHEEQYKNQHIIARGTPSLYNEDCNVYMMSEVPKFIDAYEKEIKSADRVE